MPISNNRREFWSPEQLKRAAISELLKHGDDKHDLIQLREQFKIIRDNKSADENTGTQIGDILS